MRVSVVCLVAFLISLTLAAIVYADPDPEPDPRPDPGGGDKNKPGRDRGRRRNRDRSRSPGGSSGNKASRVSRQRKNRNRNRDREKPPKRPTDEPILLPTVPISELPMRNSTPEELLLRDIFDMYSPDARAGVDSTETVNVEIQYVLLRIQKLDERTQVLTSTGLVITEWVDDRLQWDPSLYNNLTDIVVPPDYVWLPELALMNGAEQMVHDFDRMGVLVASDGKMHWEPGGIFTTTCDIDITFFPFDLQRCEIVVGAWAYYSQKMNLINASSEIKLHDYTENGEWEILETVVTWNDTGLPCCPDVRYSYVSSGLYLRRRTSYYFVNIVAPCFMLSVLVLMGFCIPPEAGEKISCGISVMLAFTVFLLMVSESVPRTSLQLPVLGIYLMCTMILGTSSTCLSILVLNVHHSHKGGAVPPCVRRVILVHLARILCMNTNYYTISWKRPATRKRRQTRDIHHHKLFPHKGSSMDSLFEILNTQGVLKTRLAAQELASEHARLAQQSPGPGPLTRGPRQGSKRPPNSAENAKSVKSSSSEQELRIQRDWDDVICVIDRLFFCLVLTAMITSTVFTLGSPYFLR